MTFRSLFFASASCFFLTLSPLEAASVKFDKETEITAGASSKFKIAAGWSFDEDSKKLVSPEGDLIAYFIEKPAEADLENLILKAWKEADPAFKYAVQQKDTPPPKDQWEKAMQIYYEVPAKENRTVFSYVRVFKGKAYVLLFNATNANLSQRGAQFKIATDSWKPNEFQTEDLSKNKIKAFTESDASEMDQFVQQAMSQLDVPGVSIAILQDDKPVYRKGFGVKKLGEEGKVTPETLFMIGSTSKPLTTLMLAKLVEMGKLKWETPIQEALPSFQLEDKDVSAKFLLKHAACACTGLPRKDLEIVFAAMDRGPEDFLQQLHSMKPTTGFGETFQYSNHLVAAGGFLGGNVYNKGSDLFSKYENAMQDLVFNPLGMDSTRVKPKTADLAKLASPHARNYTGKMNAFPQTIDDMVYQVGPAGSIWSNVEDLSKYLRLELHKGKDAAGKTLFSEEQIMKRRTPGVKVDDKSTYGLGLFIEKYKGISIISHGGNTLGFTHDLFFLPDHNVGMVVQTNAGYANAFTVAVRQKLLELLLAAKPHASEAIVYAKETREKVFAQMQSKVSVKKQDNLWLDDLVGAYTNDNLGRAEIKRTPSGYQFVIERWASEIGTDKAKSGEKLLVLTSAPWAGGFELQYVKDNGGKLILDDSQAKYEFTKVK